MHQAAVQDFFHVTIYIIGKTSDIKTFDITGDLHDGNRHHIRGHQRQHITVSGLPAQNIHQASRHPTLEPRSCQQYEVIDQTGDCYRQQHRPLGFEIIQDLILFHCLRYLFHPLLLLLPHVFPH